MFRGHEQTFVQRRLPDGQQTHEKMLNITHHQGNANQNYNAISPHTCQNGWNEHHRKQWVLVRMQRKRKFLTVLVGMQTGGATLENSLEVPKKVKNRTIFRLRNYTTKYLFKGYKKSDSKGHMHPNVYSSNVHNSQNMGIAQMPINRWKGKENVVCVCIYIYI